MSFMFTEKCDHEIGNGLHEVDRNLTLLQSMNLKGEVRRPKLQASDADNLFVEGYKKEKYFCLAPASVWFTKQLPYDKWRELESMYLLEKARSILLGMDCARQASMR